MNACTSKDNEGAISPLHQKIAHAPVSARGLDLYERRHRREPPVSVEPAEKRPAMVCLHVNYYPMQRGHGLQSLDNAPASTFLPRKVSTL
jgi:hypothetical protein